LLQGSQAAVGTLFRIMMDLDVAPGTRLQAVKYVLDNSGQRARRTEPHLHSEEPGWFDLAERLIAARQRIAKQKTCEQTRAAPPSFAGDGS
jgi:hypothetical protein